MDTGGIRRAGWVGVGLGFRAGLGLVWGRSRVGWGWFGGLGPPALPCPAGGESEEEIRRVDVLENQVMDFRMSLVMVCYSPDFEKLKPGYLEQLPGKLKLFSNFLGDRKWFAGDKLTFVDFLMFDVLDQNRIFEPKCLEPFQNLRDFMERFGALEKVAAYMKSPQFQKMPINNKMAKWGNKKL
ncbi:PREDICTED: glutathione S-transferase Mu 3-like [Lepidothrix coronata]|uniref:glutathione transferase n=1 Tax=Lepidothrix coronata TaxID=321398 RepID=A0A6J0J9F2_9PASS|nr:PREDICTED: glutathione S-transferase Mu 3-like [Lepidothrix coronata]